MKKLLIVICITVTTVAVSAQIPVDKQYHLGAGAVIGTWGTWAGNSLEYTPEKSALFGFGCAVLAGGLKEGADALGYGTPEWADLGATCAGGFISAGVNYVILKIVKKHKKPEKQDDSLYFYFGANTVQGGIKIKF